MAKKHKQNAARDRNYGEYAEISKLLDKIRSVGMGGISADDDLAVEKLTKKLEGLESLQATMKAVNAYFRKHKTLDGCPELTPEQAEKLKADMAQSWHLDKSKQNAPARHEAAQAHENILSVMYCLISHSKSDCSDGGATLFLAGADHANNEIIKRTRQYLPGTAVS